MACTQGVRPCPSPPPRHSLRILGYLRLGPCPPRPPPWLNETSPSGCRDPRAPSAPQALDLSHAEPCPWTVPCCREPIRLRRYLVFTQARPRSNPGTAEIHGSVGLRGPARASDSRSFSAGAANGTHVGCATLPEVGPAAVPPWPPRHGGLGAWNQGAHGRHHVCGDTNK